MLAVASGLLIVPQQLRDASRNTVLAIYADPQSAKSLLAASPLNFNFYPLPPRGPVTGPGSAGLAHMMAEEAEAMDQTRGADAGGSLTPRIKQNERNSVREFHLVADVSLQDHQGHIERQPYYWGFKAKANKSFAEEDLAKSVPHLGMSSLPAGMPELPLRIVKRNAEEVASRKTPGQVWTAIHAQEQGSSIP